MIVEVQVFIQTNEIYLNSKVILITDGFPSVLTQYQGPDDKNLQDLDEVTPVRKAIEYKEILHFEII